MTITRGTVLRVLCASYDCNGKEECESCPFNEDSATVAFPDKLQAILVQLSDYAVVALEHREKA